MIHAPSIVVNPLHMQHLRWMKAMGRAGIQTDERQKAELDGGRNLPQIRRRGE
jgi:hypothetical protein